MTLTFKTDCSAWSLEARSDGLLWLIDPNGGATVPTDRADWPADLGTYAPSIERAAAEFKVPPALIVGVMWQESGWANKLHPVAVSPTGARGLMQIQPEYASEFAGRPVNPDELFDPDFNIWLGTKVLRFQLDRYDGNLIKALVGYNAGHWRCGLGKGCKPNKAVFNVVENCHYVEDIVPKFNAAVQRGYPGFDAPGRQPWDTYDAAPSSAGRAFAAVALFGLLVAGVWSVNRHNR